MSTCDFSVSYVHDTAPAVISRIGVGSVAAAGALLDVLGINQPLPQIADNLNGTANTISDPHWILIWGGSCVMGSMVVQLVEQTGLRVVALASLHNESCPKGLDVDAARRY